MARVVSINWFGPADGTAMGWFHAWSREILTQSPLVTVTDGPADCVVVTAAGRWELSPPGVRVLYPIGGDRGDRTVPVIAPSRFYQRQWGLSEDPIVLGGHLLPTAIRPAGLDRILFVGPAGPPECLERWVPDAAATAFRSLAGGSWSGLPLRVADREALWRRYAMLVLLPGCPGSVSLAVEARSAGLPVLVPREDPAGELLLVNGIGAYAQRQDRDNEPDEASLRVRLDGLRRRGYPAPPVDLGRWDCRLWPQRLLGALAPHFPGAEDDGCPQLGLPQRLFSALLRIPRGRGGTW